MGHVFGICLCILMGTSTVILWQKQLNARDRKLIQNVDLPIPGRSPGSWLVNEERELESLPHQSLVQATNVHFGARPNLKSRFKFRSNFYDLQDYHISLFSGQWA